VSALHHIHSEGASHRDLKPENILLDSQNNIKIGDFGLSCLAGDGKALKTSCGSANYAAPELVNGELYDGCASDMWSTGVILYATIMGTLPFDSSCMATLFDKIKKVRYHIPESEDKISAGA